jgi:hypothetical protein
MSIVRRLTDGLYASLSGFPREWVDPARLADWQVSHADPAGDVWCVTPPYGRWWHLYPPGGAVAAAVSDIDADAEVWLADVEPWMRPWIERVAGGRVVEMVEGLVVAAGHAWFGPDATYREYVIYARVVT